MAEIAMEAEKEQPRRIRTALRDVEAQLSTAEFVLGRLTERLSPLMGPPEVQPENPDSPMRAVEQEPSQFAEELLGIEHRLAALGKTLFMLENQVQF